MALALTASGASSCHRTTGVPQIAVYKLTQNVRLPGHCWSVQPAQARGAATGGPRHASHSSRRRHASASSSTVCEGAFA